MWKTVVVAAFLFTALAAQAASGVDVSWLIGPANARTGFGEVRIRAGVTYWRLLSPSHQVLAELRQPNLPQNHVLSFGDCTRAGAEQTDLVVETSIPSERSKIATPLRAWRFDPRRRVIIPASASGIVCYNPDYGF
ncbi:hypothetical protein [Cognatilysobacter terrigena]|uniref:hypothetical protein n=1 Tax=Cognatilysobacter terrigena TaxID=2488749 RepID=UPI00105C0FA7|nr:hypothetical protein [Lysobacter terrigena]